MGLFQRLSKTLIGTGTYAQRLSVFWAFAWRAIICVIATACFALYAEVALLGPMTLPKMLEQRQYVRWAAMMLVGFFVIYGSPLFAAHWLLRSKYLRRTTWGDAARLWWAFIWRFWPLVLGTRALLSRFSAPVDPASQFLMLDIPSYAISLPLAVWLAGGGMRRLILDDILVRHPKSSSTRFCTTCGAQMSDDAAFCSHCRLATGVKEGGGP